MAAKEDVPAAAGSVVVPYGHVVGNEKWRGSEVARRLQGERKKAGLLFLAVLNILECASFRLRPHLGKMKNCS